MPKIPRKHQKIFAQNATNTGVFGSAQSGAKTLSNDPDVIQSLAAFLNGWNDATIGAKRFPTLEEMQALDFLNTYQIAYIFQEGIAEYNASATYYTNSVVKQSGTLRIYGSIVDDNTGNALTDATKWKFLQDLGASTVVQATETVAGIAEIATAAETKAGMDDTRIVTPAKLAPFAAICGMSFEWNFATLPAGYLWEDGKTIGNSGSGATARDNADVIDLYTGLWTSWDNTVLVIQTSAGAPTTRGANAATDFAAGKRLPLPDSRGRIAAGKDNMGGTAAGRLSGQPLGVNGGVLGASGGEELHSNTATENGPHSHQQTGNVGYGNVDIGGTITGPTGSPQPRWSYPTTGISGSGDGHNNVQPTIIKNKIIKY